jgi:hypothetical protein
MYDDGKNRAEYIKYHTEIRKRLGEVDVESLWATQSEIELLKYQFVRDEAFRRGEPIVISRGRMGRAYVIDGHAHASGRKQGNRLCPAVVYSTREVEVDLEAEAMSTRAGGGSARRVKDMPVVDRPGEGTEARRRRRRNVQDQ